MYFVTDGILDFIGDIYTTLLFIPCFDQDYGPVWGFPGGSDGKESPSNAGDPGVIPGLGRSLGEGNGYALQDSCLENPRDGVAWRAIVHRVAESDAAEVT